MEVNESALDYRRYTCEEIDSWDTDERYELIDGESYEICSVQIQR